jgi:hypothetical protein
LLHIADVGVIDATVLSYAGLLSVWVQLNFYGLGKHFIAYFFIAFTKFANAFVFADFFQKVEQF